MAVPSLIALPPPTEIKASAEGDLAFAKAASETGTGTWTMGRVNNPDSYD